MVSKIISFDYLNANKKDYQEFATEFYKLMAKKYKLQLNIEFETDSEYEIGNTLSECTYNLNFNPIHIHYLAFNINQLFIENHNYQKRFLEFIRCLYHELYHVLIIEISNNESCFNLTTLFSVIQYTDLIDNNFWDKNYEKIDEEINAYIYGISKASKFVKKYYPDLYNIEVFKSEIASFFASKQLHNNYSYNGESLSKSNTLNKMINNFKYNIDYPYPIMINKIYNKSENRVKTIDELIADFEYYINKYKCNPKKVGEIKKFYATIITEKYCSHEKVSINNYKKLKSFLKYKLVLKKQKLKILKKIHPIKYQMWLNEKQIISKEKETISNLKSYL